MNGTREIAVGSLRLGNRNPLFLIAGPCVIESEAHARLLIDQLGLPHDKIDITPMADPLFEHYGDGKINDLRKGNTLARIRMVAVFDRSAGENALVLGTSNKTEYMLGYTTWYGDTASVTGSPGLSLAAMCGKLVTSSELLSGARTRR